MSHLADAPLYRANGFVGQTLDLVGWATHDSSPERLMKQRVVLHTPAEMSLDVATVVGAHGTRIGSESTHPCPEAKLSVTLEELRDGLFLCKTHNIRGDGIDLFRTQHNVWHRRM